MRNDEEVHPFFSSCILDEPWSPVARFRLLSSGINPNSRLLASSEVAGDNGCLACGNCIDACPVVRQNVGLVFDQNLRTSMALENFVQDECRRCYRCVAACPQVSKGLKEVTSGFRRVEKIAHILAAFIVVSLALTGVTRLHYGNILSGFEAKFLMYAHRALGLASILVPVGYYKLDIGHFRRSARSIFRWGKSDVEWLKNAGSHLFSPAGNKKISRNEFNPAQKFWYLFVLSFFPVLYISGVLIIFMGGSAEDTTTINLKLLHMVAALSFDIMLFVHVYIKYIREWIISGVSLIRNYQQTKSFIFRNG